MLVRHESRSVGSFFTGLIRKKSEVHGREARVRCFLLVEFWSCLQMPQDKMRFQYYLFFFRYWERYELTGFSRWSLQFTQFFDPPEMFFFYVGVFLVKRDETGLGANSEVVCRNQEECIAHRAVDPTRPTTPKASPKNLTWMCLVFLGGWLFEIRFRVDILSKFLSFSEMHRIASMASPGFVVLVDGRWEVIEARAIPINPLNPNDSLIRHVKNRSRNCGTDGLWIFSLHFFFENEGTRHWRQEWCNINFAAIDGSMLAVCSYRRFCHIVWIEDRFGIFLSFLFFSLQFSHDQKMCDFKFKLLKEIPFNSTVLLMQVFTSFQLWQHISHHRAFELDTAFHVSLVA